MLGNYHLANAFSWFNRLRFIAQVNKDETDIEDNYKRKKGKLLDNEIRYLFDDIVKDAQLS